MKKNLLMLVAVFAMVCSAVFFASCSKDDDDTSKTADNAMLVGTWESTDKILYNATDYVTMTYTFTSDYKFTYSLVGGSTNEKESGTYTYNSASGALVLTYASGNSYNHYVTSLTATAAKIDSYNFVKK